MPSVVIYDSGIGGLSILRSVKNLLPQEDYIYIADKKYFPYGTQSTKIIRDRGNAIIPWAKKQNAKAVIIACNTSTVSSLKYLRQLHDDIPIIGTVPVIKTCAQLTKNGKIGVICTPKTAASEYQKELIKKFAPLKEVYVAPCPDLVETIENNTLKERYKVLEQPLKQLVDKNIDTLALGCTHFSLINDEISKIVGEKVLVLDSTDAIARQTKRVLGANKYIAKSKKTGVTVFYTTANTKEFDIMIKRYLKIGRKSQLLKI